MNRLRACALGLAAGFVLAGTAPSFALSLGECTISPDRLSVTVSASNDSDTSYACQVNCKARVENQRAFESIACRYAAPRGMPGKQVCKSTAKSGGKFTEIASGDIVCSPR